MFLPLFLPEVTIAQQVLAHLQHPTAVHAMQHKVPKPKSTPLTARKYASNRVSRSWPRSHAMQERCLVKLWNRESHWNPHALNKNSGAYGIPQALPGKKMASAGKDWRSSASTQIDWGVSYIVSRYGTPCNAWAHSQRLGWY